MTDGTEPGHDDETIAEAVVEDAVEVPFEPVAEPAPVADEPGPKDPADAELASEPDTFDVADAGSGPGPELEPEPEPAADEPEPEPAADEPEPEPAADEPEPEPAADEPEPEPEPAADEPAGGRATGLRVAGIHLRTGLHSLARAELEAFAGRGLLDVPALLDLAEVRWRTGDLAGAGEAANALLGRGSEEPLALVIAAEAVAALGRPGEARRLAGRVAQVRPGPLASLFAGMPMALIWPDDAGTPAVTAAIAGESPVPTGTARPVQGRRPRRPSAADTPIAAPAAAAEAFAGGRGALAAGDHARAALMLGVALRLEPGFAGAVLGAVAGRDEGPLLALVEGDALRLLGREAEALVAFDQARGHHPEIAGGSNHQAHAPVKAKAPGLFDDEDGPSPNDE